MMHGIDIWGCAPVGGVWGDIEAVQQEFQAQEPDLVGEDL